MQRPGNGVEACPAHRGRRVTFGNVRNFWGPFLSGKNGPQAPKNHQGERVSILSPPGPPLSPTKGGVLRHPSLGALPKLFSYRLLARPPHFVAVAGHDEPPGRYEVRPGGLPVLGEQPRGVSKEGMSQHPLFGRCEGVWGSESKRSPRAFFRGLGTFFGLQRMSPIVFVTFPNVTHPRPRWAGQTPIPAPGL